jgi:predicted dehydrogenase/threonine dehydrogenase-like Zn-dependent dehydrogenase
MKAILEDLRSGQVIAQEVPAPELRDGGILVQTHFSAISAGTERAKLEAGEMSLVQKALHRPDLVRQVLDYARTSGVKAAYQKVRSRLETFSSLGYSCSGMVLAVGGGAAEFNVGDHVACAGVGYANHAEVNFVPRNLAVRVPNGVRLEHAALTTIGAIAMQGLRQSQATFGETVAVIGAGLVGVLTVQLSKAAGCRVIAIDTNAERAKQATNFGAEIGIVADDDRLTETIRGIAPAGVDAALLTAATSSAEPIELAASIVRDRGRIVVVGDVSMAISRRTAYAKELSIVCSRSYGPGRYDPLYEEEGIDYPIGYVRWTERRNMEAFLNLLASGAMDVSQLITRRYPVHEAGKAYAALAERKAYTILLEYLQTSHPQPISQSRAEGAKRPKTEGMLRIGCIGAGGFARDVIFPVLQQAKGVVLESVASVSGITAESARRSVGFLRAQTPSEMLQNPDVNALFILSRHDSHAPYVASAIASRKAVFVEKPLAISREQLALIVDAYRKQEREGHPPFLMVGFNRRFAPFVGRIRDFFAGRREPMLVHARVNAGYIPRDHWTQQMGGGGRIVGELCHFVDSARSMIGCSIERVFAAALPDGSRYNRDNVAVTLSFGDGSIANLVYLANGDKSVPKEHFEIFCEGAVARLEDFRSLELSRNGKTSESRSQRDKGHRNELHLTLEAISSGGNAPIPFAELVEVTSACLAIEDAISTGQPVSLTAFQQRTVESASEPSVVG